MGYTPTHGRAASTAALTHPFLTPTILLMSQIESDRVLAEHRIETATAENARVTEKLRQQEQMKAKLASKQQARDQKVASAETQQDKGMFEALGEKLDRGVDMVTKEVKETVQHVKAQLRT